jgi:hypothetical protein
MNNLKQGLMEKSTLAKHAYGKAHGIQWKEVEVVQTETNVFRKYKEATQITNYESIPSTQLWNFH